MRIPSLHFPLLVTADPSHSDSSILPEELATQSVRLKEEQLRREEEKLREIELKVQREINEKRQELLAKEESLRSVNYVVRQTCTF